MRAECFCCWKKFSPLGARTQRNFLFFPFHLVVVVVSELASIV